MNIFGMGVFAQIIFIWSVGLILYSLTLSARRILICVILFFVGIWAIKFLIKHGYEEGKGKIYKRTSNGRELNQKLEGLKNYLEDYSMIDERESNELESWDDYLIYSVMFGHNKKIIEEYEKYFEIRE